jgi:hypothetical protein
MISLNKITTILILSVLLGSVCGWNGSGKGIVATVFSIIAAVECQVDYEFFQKKNSSSPSPTVPVAQAIPLGFSKKCLPHTFTTKPHQKKKKNTFRLFQKVPTPYLYNKTTPKKKKKTGLTSSVTW